MRAILKVEPDSKIKELLHGSDILFSKRTPKIPIPFTVFICSKERKTVLLTCICTETLDIHSGFDTGLHVTNVHEYDVPKHISEFKTPPCEKPETACENCGWRVVTNTPQCFESECFVEDGRYLTKLPGDWQYVEV